MESVDFDKVLFFGFLLTICLAWNLSLSLNSNSDTRQKVASEKDDMNESQKDILVWKNILVWKDLLAKPHEWWDVRSKEGSPKAAAFERKSNGELRMIDDSTPEVSLTLPYANFDFLNVGCSTSLLIICISMLCH
ncbi:protein OSB3, chloroplastic/mitochondrial-like [Rosa chinensis]|uniref:protein OSB3, chloroplastic/mitochondrial-like n=1 Tax=Rosa chinensis TaxID=74649 RepID=UPI001AD8B8A3|nr:protein OSB3, chloroplastic/mitochondrial-like [Rosa chinensis]